ncbi:hypothetical protein [Curtobacterium herbarum]|uniref:FHA domain-containing protein n=1 Tax=Curtobacterium herbarum TaxID=150122 RepID=A0ABP4K4F8_9MICO|nr:hypothetical protein [Curtobacterium herbarum]MBM7475238.1 hypothetical protein [Curtobacterium herbarum]MCS6543154.1 hypothetical protein [Curtobacterium herbarum]
MQDDEDQLDDTVLRASLRRPVRTDADGDPDAALLDQAGVVDDADVLGDTVLRPGRPVLPGRHRSSAASVPAVPVPAPTTAPTPPSRGPEGHLPVPVPSIRIGGRVHRLDRPAVVGRRPGRPRVVQGPVPELVTVPSPGGVVSSSHVLFHAAGSTAVVDDLHATNGTVIRAPGAPPYRMPAGASMVVLTGTVVDIGDGATIEVLSPYLRSVPPGGRESSGPLPVPPPTPGPSRTPRERP